MVEFEVLNVEKKNEDDEKIKKFEEKVVNYINSKDKFINKDTTIDTKIHNSRNIVGDIVKSKYNISIEGLGLCHIDKVYDYDYTKLFSGLCSCKEKVLITKIVDNETEEINREYILLKLKAGDKYLMTREQIEDKVTEIKYDSRYRIISVAIYENDELEEEDIFEYKDGLDNSFTVTEKRRASQDTEPVFISKSYIDSKQRLYRMDTATGSSKRIIFDDVTDKKLREEYYQNDVLLMILRHDIFTEETEEEDIMCVSMIKDMYMNNKVVSSKIIEEDEKRRNKQTQRLSYNRITKYHNGIIFYEKINTIECKNKQDGGRVEKQTFSLLDMTKEETVEKKEENIIEYDEANRPTLIVTIRPNEDVIYTLTEYDDENNTSSTNNKDVNIESECFEDDPETVKDFIRKDKYSSKMLYNRFNSFFEEAISSCN